jgi:hypothetical protein
MDRDPPLMSGILEGCCRLLEHPSGVRIRRKGKHLKNVSSVKEKALRGLSRMSPVLGPQASHGPKWKSIIRAQCRGLPAWGRESEQEAERQAGRHARIG